MAPSTALPKGDLLILDSIGYVAQPHFEIADTIIVSGSHGGTAAAGYILDHPQKPRLVFFNDAGGGKDQAGVAGLEILNMVQVAACAYSHLSARIGQAQDGFEHGVLTHCNGLAAAMGLVKGTPVQIAIQSLQQALAPSSSLFEATSATSALPTSMPGAQTHVSSKEPDPLGPPLKRFNDPSYQPKADNLATLREGIDELDEAVIALLAQRAMLVKDAARFKADHFQVAAPRRQAEVFSKVRQCAMRHNLGFEGFEDVVEQSYRTMVAQFIAKESLYFDQLLPVQP